MAHHPTFLAALATACALALPAHADTTLTHTRNGQTTQCTATETGVVVCEILVQGVQPAQRPAPLPPTFPPHPMMPMDDPLPPLGTQDFNPDASISSPPFPGTDGGGSSGAPGVAMPEPMEPPMVDAMPMPDMTANCALERAQALFGMAWDDSLLEGIAAPGAVRVLGPNDAATMDYSPTRLNILLDEARNVVDASCG